MIAPYIATYQGRSVLVVCDWQHLRASSEPTAVIEYGEPEQRGDDVYARRATVPLSELTKIETEE